MKDMGIILTLVGGTFTLVFTIVGATWKLGNRFSRIEAWLSGFDKSLEDMNRRIERLESKIN